MRQSRGHQAPRGVAAASVATCTALLSHLAGGGLPPTLFGVAVPWVLSLIVCTILSGRKLSLLRMSASVALSQLLFHMLFVLGATPHGAAHHGHGAHHDHAQHHAPPADSTLAMVQGDVEMWLWHGFAAVVTIAALYRGEQAILRLRSLARQIAMWARRTLSQPIPVPLGPPDRCPVLVVTEGTRGLGDDPLACTVRRRGPPRVRVL
ncbi:hypothetical protein [Actinoalloteichus hymeniacidonis]|uniref:hypothetical protein n=1 Tax=Actinoalloteichus hymeniacidonis TaxID=340345 RepID=UPI0012F8ECEE|nr:hypothetical protein [Actinoalloteichus hymeniacidonis]MBB5909902.1 hypothetical protein [Actinoalloteichus hymeniacidonis]